MGIEMNKGIIGSGQYIRSGTDFVRMSFSFFVINGSGGSGRRAISVYAAGRVEKVLRDFVLKKFYQRYQL